MKADNKPEVNYCLMCGKESNALLCDSCKDQLNIVSVVDMKFQKVDGGYIPLSQLMRYCGICGSRIRYRKTHHYGPEGKWCDGCRVWVYRTW